MNHKEGQDRLFDDREGAVQVVHAREVAALMESLGYTDRSAEERGFPDIFSLAEHLFALLRQNPAPDDRVRQKSRRSSLWAETRCALRKFSLSLAYAIPWAVLLTLEYLRPDAVRVSPEIGGALSLSLIASLITTGGFVQMISRSGNFYYGLKEPVLAHRTCITLLNIGLTSSLFLTLLGMIAGSYFHLFAGNYLVLAAINYLALSILWMLCAVLSAQGIGWCLPQHSHERSDKNAHKPGYNRSVDTLPFAGSGVRARLCAGGFLLRTEQATAEQGKRPSTRWRPVHLAGALLCLRNRLFQFSVCRPTDRRKRCSVGFRAKFWN